jgi:hypothetical protein
VGLEPGEQPGAFAAIVTEAGRRRRRAMKEVLHARRRWTECFGVRRVRKTVGSSQHHRQEDAPSRDESRACGLIDVTY